MPGKKDVTAQLKLNKLRHAVKDQESTIQFLKTMVQQHNARVESPNKKYVQATITNDVYPKVELALFYNEYEAPASKFPELLVEISDDMYKYLKIKRSNFNYVLFIWNSKGIFAVTGGTGYTLIDRYIDREFGYKFLTYMGKDRYNVVSSAEKRIAGNIYAMERVFREEYDYSTENHFGVSIDKLDVTTKTGDIQSIFDIKFTGRQKKVACNIDNGLSIRKRVSLRKIIGIVRVLLDLDLEKNDFAFLKVISNAPKNRTIITELNDELWSLLYKYCTDTGSDGFDFDIMGPQTSQFISASEYTFHEGSHVFEPSCPHFSNIKEYFKNLGKQIASRYGESGFETKFRGIFLRASGSDGEEISDLEFFEHISCEVTLNQGTYFRINQKWSYVDDSFQATLRDNFRKIVDNYLVDGLFETQYSGQKEGDYIDELCKEDGAYKLHQLNPDGKHEFCDILKVKDSEVYIVHVKVGTGVALRELAQQVELCAVRYRETKASIKAEYFEKIFDSLERNHRTKGLTKKQFEEIINSNHVCFVAMICSDKGATNLLDAIDSCIAKYSLVSLIYQRNAIGYPICIYPMLV